MSVKRTAEAQMAPSRLGRRQSSRPGRRSVAASGRGIVLASVLRAIRLLHAGRWTITELGTELGRGRRTAYRVVKVLEAQGLRIERNKEGREVYYRIAREEMERWLTSAPELAEAEVPNRQRCSTVGCSRLAHARGRCHAHDMRRRSGSTLQGPVRRIRRLNDDEAAEVRRRYAGRSKPTIPELARAFGMARVHVLSV
jgi:DNA-binding transcriptional ArsR family regulator